MYDDNIDNITFVQVLYHIFYQMRIHKVIKGFGDSAQDAIKKELNQMHLRDSFILIHSKDLTRQQWNNIWKAVNLMKLKNVLQKKEHVLMEKQRNFISKEDSVSPTRCTALVI